jgi:hypothetical protein
LNELNTIDKELEELNNEDYINESLSFIGRYFKSKGKGFSGTVTVMYYKINSFSKDKFDNILLNIQNIQGDFHPSGFISMKYCPNFQQIPKVFIKAIVPDLVEISKEEFEELETSLIKTSSLFKFEREKLK